MPVYRLTYLFFGASYFPADGGIWKKGNPGARVWKFSIPTQKFFFGMHLRECVSIAQVPANPKHAEREGEFFLVIFFWCKLCPMAGSIWKKSNPGYRKQTFSFLRWFFAVLLNFFLSTGTSPSQPQSWQMIWIHSQLSSLGASYAPKTSDILKRGNPGCRKKILLS